MPRKNRVNPFGELVENSARGTLMGNRGCLHDGDGNVRKRWARKPWVICLLEYKGRKQQVMAPGKYTQLFFLDEATALAAGHRPCHTCQREKHTHFKRLWFETNDNKVEAGKKSIATLDACLHRERLCSAGEEALWQSKLSSLPDGVMLLKDKDSNQAWLKWKGRLHRWGFGGYEDSTTYTGKDLVSVITPESIARVLSAGYDVGVHSTVGGTGRAMPGAANRSQKKKTRGKKKAKGKKTTAAKKKDSGWSSAPYGKGAPKASGARNTRSKSPSNDLVDMFLLIGLLLQSIARLGLYSMLLYAFIKVVTIIIF